MNTLQCLNVFLLERGSKLNTVLEMQTGLTSEYKGTITSLVLLATLADTNQDATGLDHLGTLLAHVQPAVKQQPQVLF